MENKKNSKKKIEQTKQRPKRNRSEFDVIRGTKEKPATTDTSWKNIIWKQRKRKRYSQQWNTFYNYIKHYLDI